MTDLAAAERRIAEAMEATGDLQRYRMGGNAWWRWRPGTARTLYESGETAADHPPFASDPAAFDRMVQWARGERKIALRLETNPGDVGDYCAAEGEFGSYEYGEAQAPDYKAAGVLALAAALEAQEAQG